MVKGSSGRVYCPLEPFFCLCWGIGPIVSIFIHINYERKMDMKTKENSANDSAIKSIKDSTKKIIAFRKACKAQGTGLSHYILMDKRRGQQVENEGN